MESITQLSINDLHESPFNPRRTFRESGLQELATDIAANGLLSPLLVRPRIPALFRQLSDTSTAAVGYELVFGHRRLRAAQLAGMVEVPCMVRSMTDEEVRRAQISENLSREDVHPIEEAEGFQALIDDGTETADSLADRYGKSKSYVYARLTLTKACKAVREACVAGKIGTEVALLITRLRTERLQTLALSRISSKNLRVGDGGTRSYREIRDLLRDEFTLSLGKGCIFDVADALLLPNADACTTCPKRSGNAPEFQDLATDQPGRFDGYPARGDAYLCTDPDCYAAKKAAHLRNQAAELERMGKVVVEGNKARAAIGADGKVKGGYIAVSEIKSELQRAKQTASRFPSTIAQPQVVVIQDPRTGKTVEAVKEADLAAAGTRTMTPKAAKEANSYEERIKRDQAKRRADELAAAELSKTHRALLARVRPVIHQSARDARDLQLVARVAVNGAAHRGKSLLAELWACEDTEELIEKVESMSCEDLTRLLMDCVLVEDVDVGVYSLDKKPTVLLETAARYGVAIEPEPSEPLPSAARAIDVATVVAKGVKYMDPMTGSTWTGRGLKPRWLTVALESGRTLDEFAVSTPATAAQAPTKAVDSDADQEAEDAGSAGQDQMDEAGCAGEEQVIDAGADAGGSDAEVEA